MESGQTADHQTIVSLKHQLSVARDQPATVMEKMKVELHATNASLLKRQAEDARRYDQLFRQYTAAKNELAEREKHTNSSKHTTCDDVDDEEDFFL